jgi:hypothetical protein
MIEVGLTITGKLALTIPPFVKLEHDTALRKAFVTVEDREIKQQREMWGTASCNIPIPCC